MRPPTTLLILAMLAPLSLVAACSDDVAAPTTTIIEATTTVAPATEPSTVAPATTAPVTSAPATSAPATSAPATTTHAPTPASTSPAELVDVKVYLLREERLVIAHRQVAAPAVLRGALDALLAGPTPEERASGMTTTVPEGTSLRAVDLDPGASGGGQATIDLTGAFGSGGGSLSMSARVAQIVFTATQFPNVDRVVFWMDGEPGETLGGEGVILTEPHTRSMVDRELSGSVIIDTPHPGDTVTGAIRVVGEGDVYEAQFPIEIWQAGVQVGGLAPVTAGAWGTWGSFDVTIPLDAPAGPIEIVTYDPGGCGTGPECPEIIKTVVELQFAG